jgi:hypothetical protein
MRVLWALGAGASVVLRFLQRVGHFKKGVQINDLPGAVARVLPSIPGPKTWMFYFPEFSSQSAAKA